MAAGQGRGVVLGYLRYVLGFDTLAFEEGADAADKKLKATQKSMERTASKIKAVGGVFTVGLTAPIAAAGVAFVSSAREIADSIGEITKSAQLANVGFVEFQRLAYAAKSVGIESDKLSDIYKDVNDRVGEFIQSGGGEMKDFFTNIAPKVGVTAEMFKGLSGPQALQLYVTSLQKAGLNQQEMTFYMEAMADEATALLPLLANNGAAMEQLGKKAAVVSPEDAAKMKAYTDAQRQMGESFKALTIALVSSGFLEKLTEVIIKITEWTAELAKTNPELLAWGAGIAAAAAAFGPALVGIGGMVSGFGKMLPLLMKTGPLWKGLAGIISGTVMPVILSVGRALVALAIAGGPLTMIAAAVAAIVVVWRNWDTIGPIVQRLYTAVKTWLLDKLGAVWKSVKDMLFGVGDWFFKLYDRVVGHSYIPDMVDEIGQNMARLQKLMVDPAQKMTKDTGEAFRAMASRVAGIVDELFPKTAALREAMADLIALQNDETLTPGARQAAIDKQIRKVLDAQDEARAEVGAPAVGKVEPVAGALDDAWDVAKKAGEDASKALVVANDNAASSFVDMANKSLNALSNLAQAIKGGGILDILSSAMNAFGALAGSGILGQGLKTSFANFTPISGFRANGGPVGAGQSYVVGERGPELFTPTRSGYVHANGNERGLGRRGGNTYHFQGNVMTPEFWGAVQAMDHQAAIAGGNMGSTGAQIALAKSAGRRIP